MRKLSLKYFTAIGLVATTLLMLTTSVRAEPTQTCQFDPELGVPNPLGMRAYITITEEEGDTTFLALPAVW